MKLKIKPMTIGPVMPYNQVYTTSTNGAACNIISTTTSRTTVYTVYRFYPIQNITTYTEISANITGRVRYWGTSSTGRINVSIWDYNPADGSRTKYGECTNVTIGGAAQTNYNFQLKNPAFDISADNKVVGYVNVTTPTTGSMGRRR